MPTEVEIRAPAEQTEGTRSQILRWLKSVGDIVTENEPLIEIESDKVTVEVASPGSGTLREILKQEQDEIGPGDLLGRIDGGALAAANGAVTVDAAVAKPSVASATGTTSRAATSVSGAVSASGAASGAGVGPVAGAGSSYRADTAAG